MGKLNLSDVDLTRKYLCRKCLAFSSYFFSAPPSLHVDKAILHMGKPKVGCRTKNAPIYFCDRLILSNRVLFWKMLVCRYQNIFVAKPTELPTSPGGFLHYLVKRAKISGAIFTILYFSFCGGADDQKYIWMICVQWYAVGIYNWFCVDGDEIKLNILCIRCRRGVPNFCIRGHQVHAAMLYGKLCLVFEAK